MALNNTAMTVAATALQGALGYAQLHSAAAGGSGTSNLCSSGRVAVTWGSITGAGVFGLGSNLNFTGVAANGAVYSVTLWSASSGGTFYGEFVLTGDATANSSGQYTVTTLNLTGSAS